ncbi:MAG TPA: hypothetical protein VHB97_25825 [Polyangia bacterium]|nr:hypothetical protein [Polyangia bacterium]
MCLRIDNKMRDQLAQAPARDKVYFDGSDPRYLVTIRTVEDNFIGKVIDGGTPAASMDDLKRNLLSILTRVAPGRHREDAVKVFALDDGEPPPEPRKRGENDEDEDVVPAPRNSYY